MAKNTVGMSLSEKYREFFQPIVDELREKHQFTKRRKVQPRNFCDFASGHGRVVYGANFHGRTFHKGVCIAVCVYIKSSDEEWNKHLFDKLEERKKSIESRLGFGKLDWARLDDDDTLACRISALRDGTIEDASKNPEEIRGWMIDRLVAFRRVFGPILDGLLR